MYLKYLFFIALFVIFLLPPFFSYADLFSKKQKELEVIEERIDSRVQDSKELEKKDKVLSTDIRKIQEALVRSAKLVQDGEIELNLIEGKISKESEALQERRQSIVSSRKTISQIFAALERIAIESPSRLIFYHDRPINKIHGMIVMRSYLRTLRERVSSLNSDFEKVTVMLGNMSVQKDQLIRNLKSFDSRREELKSLLEEKSVLSQKLNIERGKVTQKTTELQDDAESLERLIQSLQNKPTIKKSLDKQSNFKIAMKTVTPMDLLAYSGFSFKKAKGKVILPAYGKISLRHNLLGDSKKMQGINITTRENAQVVSPYDGEIMFAGEFRGYGKMLIISHGDEYHTLLTGISEISCKTGEKVIVGEPVGIMGKKASEGINLYMEVRYTGEPINFLPWLAKENVVG